MQLPHTNVSLWVEKQVTLLGDLVSWIWLVLLATIVVNVVMRYLFGQGRIEFEEIQWHLYAIGFLLGLSYAYVSDIHIRVDVVREKLSEQAQAWIEQETPDTAQSSNRRNQQQEESYCKKTLDDPTKRQACWRL